MTKVRWRFAVGVLAMLGMVLFPVCRGYAADDWRVKEAPVRFTLSLPTSPSHVSCGYFVQLPDGGILPKPFPLTQVFDQAGNPLKSYVLWQNSDTGVGIVFEAPASAQEVSVYVTATPQLKIWSPASGLTPSAIICTHSGVGSRVDALKMSRFGQVESVIHYRNQARSETAGLCLPGDRLGRPGPTAMYMLAYLVTKEPGPTWIAPKSYGGDMEFNIDGQKISPAKLNEKPGGVGQMVSLSEGLHRLDAYGFASGKGESGMIFLMIRTPKNTIGDLGGARPADLKYPGTPMLEARHVRDDEVARSGSCNIEKVERQDGGPVATFSLAVKDNFWFGDEAPLIHYSLSASKAGSPKETDYTWSFSSHPGAATKGAKVMWLFPGGGKRDTRVTLTAVCGDKQSQCTVPFYPFSEIKTSLENPSTREGFRDAVLTMLKAYPEKADPVASWDASMWNNVFRNLDLGEGAELLLCMFNRWEVISKKLSDDRQTLLENLFFFVIPKIDAKESVKWAEMLEKKAATPAKAAAMKLRQAEILMYYLKDFEEAKKRIKPVLGEAGDLGAMAKIRMGDAGFLAHDMNEATKYYGDVQNTAKYTNKATVAPPPKKAPVGLAHSKKELEEMRQKEVKPKPRPTGEGNEPLPVVAKWKEDAVRDVAASENIKNLIDQRFYLEAYTELKRWERVYPLSKISGDYFLLESRLYMALHDYGRARIVLEAYCEQVDASNFLGEAMNTIKTCMFHMKESDANINKFIEKVKKRMKFQDDKLQF